MPKGFKAPVTTLSPEAKKYKLDVLCIARGDGIDEPIKGRVSIQYFLYPNRPLDYKKRMTRDPYEWDDTVQCIDLDNAQKVMLDSLKNVVMEDDKFVRKITGERMEPDGNGARLIVIVTSIATEKPDLFGNQNEKEFV